MKSFRSLGNLSKGDMRGLLVIFMALLVVAGIRYGMSRMPVGDPLPPVSGKERELLDSLAAQAQADSLRYERRGAIHDPDYGISQEKLFPFDPNTADSATLVRLGLYPWQASNVLKYRRKGGKWRTPDDFARLYGLTEEDFRLLRPYIRIEAPGGYAGGKDERASSRDSVRRKYPEKFPEGTVVDLNAADTVQLKRIPGIGSYYAGKICRYRERLGGFLHVEQIKEVEGLPVGIERWFCVSPQVQVRKIDINGATFKQLVRHPYLSYEQVKVISEHIRKRGPLHGWDDLRLYDEFSPEDFRRLCPYFYFKR